MKQKTELKNVAFSFINRLPEDLPRPPELPAFGTRMVSPESTPNQLKIQKKAVNEQSL